MATAVRSRLWELHRGERTAEHSWHPSLAARDVEWGQDKNMGKKKNWDGNMTFKRLLYGFNMAFMAW